uniref:Bet v I/Major latex protein domain-containing protein n=1 Tax=Prasinoderma coloniale TaxID=156133 RepID=A0A7R9TNC0_9VIRI
MLSLTAVPTAARAPARPAQSRRAARGMKFMKKLGLQKPDWLPDFGKPKEFTGQSKQVAELKFSDISADKMWATISPFAAPYVEKAGVVAASEATGDTVGSTRTISVIGTDASFEEVLVLADAEKKAFAYSITDCAKTPFPLTTYGSKCYVMEDGEGCSVTWTGWYDIVEGTKDEEVPDFVGLYTGFINAAAEDARSA